jgi:hypothetical protein
VSHTEYNFAIEVWIGREVNLLDDDMVAIGVAVCGSSHFEQSIGIEMVGIWSILNGEGVCLI